MKRIALCSLATALACGGQPARPEQPAPPVADEPAAVAPPVDQHALARQAFRNPGGMWLPTQMVLPQHRQIFQQLGVAIDSEVLSNPLLKPLAAIVMAGGCSASFVSPQGLVVTNHHCVQGALQLNSTPQQNLVENGFLAKTLAEEKSAGPAQRIMVAQAFSDVTEPMRAGLEAIADPIARKSEHDRRLKQLQSECEKGRSGVRCEVRNFFRGAQYLLIEYLELRDVRLVYAPKRSVGNYGGEIDNWAWPRHTGDFSFYRAYVGKDGKPADYSPDNVPFRPAHYLTVSAAGVRAGDVVMVAGYPGITNRISLASELRHDTEWRMPTLIALLQQRYAIAEKHLTAGGETAIKAGVLKQGIQNALERWQGMLRGALERDLLSRKQELEVQVQKWAAVPGREGHAAAIQQMERLLAEERATARADFERTQLTNASALLSAALTAARLAEERPKPDAERKPGLQERDLPRLLAAQKQLTRQYDPALDRATLRLLLARALDLPEAERPWLAALLGAKKGRPIDEALIDRTLDTWYKNSKLAEESVRLALLSSGSSAALRTSRDPLVAAAARLWPFVKAAEDLADARTGELLLLSPHFATAMRDTLGGFLAPDANSTLRVSYGTVRSFAPESTAAADSAFTTASQILAKDKGASPFDAPAEVLAAIRSKTFGPYAEPALGGELPVNFLSDMDTTGGNSGSAILNHKGELVGLHFDRPLRAVASDIVFDNQVSRTITVDARYMLWMMDTISGADHLLVEMGLTPQLP